MSKSLEPSAPPEESDVHYPNPRLEQNELQRTAAGQGGTSNQTVNQHQNSDNSNPQQPPPSYQDAINYPPAYQPNTFPKPQTDVNPPQDFQYPPYPTHYNSMPGGGAQPVTNSYVIHHAPVLSQPSLNTITVVPSGNCVHCLTGHVQNDTDVCCLVCLILLAICTFPFGLLLLCCVPCTVRRRCIRCRRLNPS